MIWQYGVTTVPSRMGFLLPMTLDSLFKGGFPNPRLFIDGQGEMPSWVYNYQFTVRSPVVRTAANWTLSAWELYLRNPLADRYAIFQDDMSTYLNLREYLEECYPENGYLNLYLFPENEKLAKGRVGWYPSNQCGRGAVALVFSNEAMRTLLRHKHLVERPRNRALDTLKPDYKEKESFQYKSIDGAIIEAMSKSGYTEFVHYPSLVQHTGLESSMDNKPHPQAPSFKGSDFNALELL